MPTRSPRFVKRLVTALLAAFALHALFACSRSGAPTDPPKSGEGAQSETIPPAPSGKPFGALCTKDEECAQSVCFHKRMKGADAGPERRDVRPEAEEREGYCSLHCAIDTDCPTPLTRGKCGARGMCKRPD